MGINDKLLMVVLLSLDATVSVAFAVPNVTAYNTQTIPKGRLNIKDTGFFKQFCECRLRPSIIGWLKDDFSTRALTKVI
jgi:hypothetical protein